MEDIICEVVPSAVLCDTELKHYLGYGSVDESNERNRGGGTTYSANAERCREANEHEFKQLTSFVNTCINGREDRSR